MFLPVSLCFCVHEILRKDFDNILHSPFGFECKNLFLVG